MYEIYINNKYNTTNVQERAENSCVYSAALQKSITNQYSQTCD
jgi:hypothetical protein